MARRKNHHPRNNECASSVRSASLASSSNRLSGGNVNSPGNNCTNAANNRVCAVSNESRTILRRSNGIRVQSEAEEEEGEGEEDDSGEDEVAEDEEDDGDGDDEDGRREEDDAKSNNSNNQNFRRKSVKRKRRKRLGRPPQNLSMDETNSANGSVGSATRQLTNGCQQSFQCPSCKKEVDSASEFTRHIRQHNTVEAAASSTHSCSLCGKVLSSASSLDRHMLVHSGERPFKCSRCDMAFTTNGNMHRHMRTHHDGGYKSSSPSLNNSIHNNNSNISDDEYNNNTTKKSRGTAVKRKLHMPKSGANGATGRNLWPKRSRGSADDEEDEEEAMDEEDEEEAMDEEEKDGEENNMITQVENGADDDSTFQCLLCGKSFLRKAVLTRHLDEHAVEDFKCADCEEPFDDWKTLYKHLHTVHLKSLEEPTLILGPDGETTVVNINNNNVKDADTGFHDLTFVDFSTAKFALIAKSACEKHARRPSSAYYSFQCHHCWKAFPCESSLKMHMKTTHVLANATRKSTPPPNATTTCVKCQADFPTHHHLETHSLRHQATEQCATPYSKLSAGESRQMQKMQPMRVVTGDAAPDIDLSLDKKSFLALLELQSRNEAEVAPEEGEVSQNKKNAQSSGRCGAEKKTPRVIDTHSNDFADIQSMIDITSSTTTHIIPSILKTGSSPATTRPPSTPSADLPASPRLADSVTASPELPSPEKNQTPADNDSAENEKSAEETATFAPENETNKESHIDDEEEEEEEEEEELETEDDEDSSDDVPLIMVKKNSSQPPAEESFSSSSSAVMDLSSTAGNLYVQPSPIIPSLSDSVASFTPVQPLPRNIIFGPSGAYPKQKAQEESDSMQSLIDFTNSAAAFQPPQEQPLDLAIQPIDLTKRFANDSSSASVAPLSLTSTSGLPMDLSAATRQRISSHRMSPLMTSTPSGGGARRIGPIISTLSSQAAAAAAAASAAAAAVASQAPQQVTVENTTPVFSNRFNSTLLTSGENFSTAVANLSLHQTRFPPEAVRRPIPVQQVTHQLMASVGESVVPLAMNQHASSHMNHMENTLRSTTHSVNSAASSAFLLKKQKQRRYRTERPFKCDYCAAGFTLRSNMERHIKQQHPEFWASKSRGRKDRALPSHSLSSRPTSISPSLPIQMPSPRILHSVTVPNVAFPSIPPPQNVSEYNPVLAAANLSITRPPLILNRSPSPPTLPPIASRMSSSVPNSNPNKSAVTISDEVKQAISNQIKQRQSADAGTLLSLTAATPINMVSIVAPITSHSDTGSDSVLNSPVESNHSGKASSIRNIWRPAPQMESEAKSAAEDADECGADLASVSKLLSTANQQNIQELFRKRRSGDEDEEEENEYESNGHKTEESEEDQPLANFKAKESGGGEMLPKTPERSKDGRKSAYVNAPNRVACPYCNRQFPWTSSLRRHVLTHTGQKPFKCPKCPLWFTTKSNCDRHLSRKHGGSAGGSLTSGIASSGSTSNVICEASENSDGQLNVNSTQNSSLPNNLSSQNVDCTARNAPDRPYRCNMCLSSTFSTPGNLQKHMMTKHPLAPNAVSAVRTKQSQKEFSSANNTPLRSDSATSVRIEANGGGGESNSGSEKCWCAESEESGEDQLMSENGQSDGAPLFFCFVCLKSFEDRGHCLEHLKDYHPDEHGFLIKTDNEQLISGIQREKSSSDAEEP